ncbi:MAG: site-2 protease family protein [Bacteroidota bacterium]
MEPSLPSQPPARPPFPSEAESVLVGATPPAKDRYWLHALLFLLTAVTTTWAGGSLVGRDLLYEEFGRGMFVWDGLRYAVPLLFFLTVHEFGHYIAARRSRLDVSLPYYVPFPAPMLQPNIGTFGAVIRIREPLRTTRQLFDVGAAGPLAGFVAALGVLLYALATLPPPAYIFDLGGHEPLKLFVDRFGAFPDFPLPDVTGVGRLTIGQTPLYWVLTQFFPNVPPMYEMYHYPVLFAGWLGLFFTALNMLPVGQLDGGHIVYALVGPRWHGRIARAFVIVLLFSATLGLVLDAEPLLRQLARSYRYAEALGGVGVWVIAATLLYFFLGRLFDDLRARVGGLFGLVAAAAFALRIEGVAEAVGYTGWFFWCLLILLLIRVDHPPVTHPETLTRGRRVLGILALLLFVLCFSFKPLYIA